MDLREARQEKIVAFRKEKQQVFESEWNQFLNSPRLFTALILYAVAQGIFTLLSFFMIRDISLTIGILQSGYPFWCNLVILLVQLLLSVPGILTVLGFFLLRKNGTLSPETSPYILGCQLIRGANFAICGAGGLALAIYPTVMIAMGENIMGASLVDTFWVFFAVTLIFLLSVIFLRLILRKLEENISCRRADGDFLLLTLILMPVTMVLAILCLPIPTIETLVLLPTTIAAEYVLFLYWRLIRQISESHQEIDEKARAILHNTLDPYSNYT